jgi:hypothetical protein
MALNETTGIDPVTDRFVIWRVSTSQFTNMNATWPRTDGGAIVGANPDFQYFKKVAGTSPDYDHRYTLTTEFGKVLTTPAPAEGLPVGTYEATYTLVKLPVEDLKLQVENEFQHQLTLQFPQTNNPAVLIEAADALARKDSGAVLTEAQQAKIDAIVGVGDVLAMLRSRQAALNAAIDADEDYDITIGWVS